MAGKSDKYGNFFFVFGLIAITFMAYKIGFKDIYANLLKTGIWFFVIMGVWLIVYLLNSVSFGLIIKDGSYESKKIKISRIVKIVISGFALNYITPFGLMGGEPYRIMELKSSLGIKKSTSTVILYTMMHIVSHLILWILSVLLIIVFVPNIGKGLSIVLWSIFIACTLLMFWAFRGYKKGMVFRLFKILAKQPIMKTKIKNYLIENESNLKEIDFYIADLFANRKLTFFLSLFFELMARMFSALEIYVILFALNHNISYIYCVIILALSSLFSNLFFFMPLQAGAREGGFALAFSSLSLLSPIGIYVSLSTRIRELFWIVLGVFIMKLKTQNSG